LGGARGRLISEERRQQCLVLIDEACKAGARKCKACEVLEIDIRTVERWEKQSKCKDQRCESSRTPENKLTEQEVNAVLNIINHPDYQGLSPEKIVPLLADQGIYIASESSFYRIMRAQQLLAHRSKSKSATQRHKPDELVATAPNQVWSWDITYLKTHIKGVFLYLYAYMDVYSRKLVGWQIHEHESSECAADLLKAICAHEGIDQNKLVIHSDNGSPMKGATLLATMYDLGIVASYSRARVSNDNPYSEALFKTLKYVPEYPDKGFVDLQTARQWTFEFVHWYNEIHLHKGINFVTPSQKHAGADVELLKQRDQVYQAAKQRNPNRWTGSTRDWSPVEVVVLNPDNKRSNTTAACIAV